MENQTKLIAIGGCSCSGKTTLARTLAQALGGTVVPLDSYYRDLSHFEPPARARVNFDEPEAIESTLLLRDLRSLMAGGRIERPVYDYATHTRARRAVTLEAGDTFILEGLFALYWRELRELCALRVFVDASEQTCLERRIARDVAERGRTEQSVREQFEATVRPMARRYVLPTREFADIVVPGEGSIEGSTRAVLDAWGRRTEL